MVAGLVVALAGVAIVVRARLRARPVLVEATYDAPVDDLADLLDRAGQVFRATDRALRLGVAVTVVGLLVAGVGAWLVSDMRAFGADVGGGASSDREQVGGTW